MKLNQVLQLHTALSSLSGTITHIIEGKPVQASFRFTGATRMAIARALRVLTPFVEDHKSAAQAIVKQLGGPWESPCDAQKHAVEEVHALEQTEIQEPPIIALPEAEFTHDDNPVPPAVLETLLDYLK